MALEPPRQTTNNGLSEQFLTETIPVGWPWRLLIFAILIFVFSIFTFLGLKFGYQSYLDKQSAEFDRNLEALGKKVSLEDQDRFVNFYSKLVNLKKVIDNHPYPLNIFTFLEKNVVTGVYFTELSANVLSESIELKGFALNLGLLSQQVAVIEDLPETESILIKSINLGQGSSGVNFTVAVNFKKGFLSKPM